MRMYSGTALLQVRVSAVFPASFVLDVPDEAWREEDGSPAQERYQGNGDIDIPTRLSGARRHDNAWLCLHGACWQVASVMTNNIFSTWLSVNIQARICSRSPVHDPYTCTWHMSEITCAGLNTFIYELQFYTCVFGLTVKFPFTPLRRWENDQCFLWFTCMKNLRLKNNQWHKWTFRNILVQLTTVQNEILYWKV